MFRELGFLSSNFILFLKSGYSRSGNPVGVSFGGGARQNFYHSQNFYHKGHEGPLREKLENEELCGTLCLSGLGAHRQV
jgi:hypothetical protein